ncbi:MAG: pyruvate synthase [Oscillospiraceae bacterium]|nr:pyruvate synthase [Oscillospiraceae bacterium]
MKQQTQIFESGNELAAYAARQINYHVMGYYPITPSTQIAEELDAMYAAGEHDIRLIAAEGEHSAAGVCYGASTGGGRVFNATSANGLLYALEQLPVQSGTRYPMVMNVACRTVSGPLSIKGDHSDLMYCLNTGWIILFANDPQAVYDMNLCALKIAEKTRLPVIVAFDGFFTSHQKRKCSVFALDADVREFVGEYQPKHSTLDLEHPITVGSYMNEPDIINNKYQLHLGMEYARDVIPEVFSEYGKLSGRQYQTVQGYRTEDAEVILFLLGSSYHTACAAADELREQGKRVGVCTANVLRPFPKELKTVLKNATTVVVGDRQDSYGAGGGNLSLEIRALLEGETKVKSRVYGLGGLEFFREDAKTLFEIGFDPNAKEFDYLGQTEGIRAETPQFFAPITESASSPGITQCTMGEHGMEVRGGALKDVTAMPKRLAPGHGACPGCGIPVNVNLFLSGIEGNVVLLFQTGCGMVVTTGYPNTAFRVPYLHNLFQNGAATLSGLSEMFYERQRRGELPSGDITFVMVSGDGGMDIGMGSALGAALRGSRIILLEYDNGGYMNTGYQLSYSTPKGAKSATSHLGRAQSGKGFFHKDMPMIMAGSGIPYLATAAESHPADLIKKAAKAKYCAQNLGMAYVRVLSACPLNWGDQPNTERAVICAAVDACYFPLFEIEQGITKLNYTPKEKLPVKEWFSMMGRTKHLAQEKYQGITEEIQAEVDRRWARLKARHEHPLL